MECAIHRTIAEFLNSNGGTLVVGVADNGSPVGIDEDGFANEDKMSLHLVNIVNSRLGPQAMTKVHIHFEDYQDCRAMMVRCH